MTVHTINEAWNAADEIFPTDYLKDDTASEKAGYPIYKSTCADCNAWISDLGNRLEVNLENGETVNIWIDSQEETPVERRETVITMQADIHKGNRKNRATEHIETTLILSHETTIKDIAVFERDAMTIVRKARKAAKSADWAHVSISKAVYRFTSCEDIKQESFQHWCGSGDAITEDGVHLTPSEEYNDDPAHDMWLTGARGDIFSEITI